ncbi:MAG: hypothetical protein LW825_04085 [Candidatus Jidaibacter sp.]|nr:hypothetical protein [Candidatus Jidaibacter sp.]
MPRSKTQVLRDDTNTGAGAPETPRKLRSGNERNGLELYTADPSLTEDKTSSPSRRLLRSNSSAGLETPTKKTKKNRGVTKNRTTGKQSEDTVDKVQEAIDTIVQYIYLLFKSEEVKNKIKSALNAIANDNNYQYKDYLSTLKYNTDVMVTQEAVSKSIESVAIGKLRHIGSIIRRMKTSLNEITTTDEIDVIALKDAIKYLGELEKKEIPSSEKITAAELSKGSKQVQILKSVLIERNSKVSELEEKLKEAKEELAELTSLRQQNYKLNQDNTGLEEELEKLKAKREEDQKELTKTEGERKNLAAQVTTLTIANDGLKKALKQSQAASQELQTKNKRLEASVTRYESLDTEYGQAQAESKKLNAELSELQKANEALSKDKEEAETAQQKLKEENATLVRKKAEAKEKAVVLEGEKLKLEKQLAEANIAAEAKDKEIAELKESNTKLSEQVSTSNIEETQRELQKALKAKQTEIETLQQETAAQQKRDNRNNCIAAPFIGFGLSYLITNAFEAQVGRASYYAPLLLAPSYKSNLQISLLALGSAAYDLYTHKGDMPSCIAFTAALLITGYTYMARGEDKGI